MIINLTQQFTNKQYLTKRQKEANDLYERYCDKYETTNNEKDLRICEKYWDISVRCSLLQEQTNEDIRNAIRGK